MGVVTIETQSFFELQYKKKSKKPKTLEKRKKTVWIFSPPSSCKSG
jgi:hypothetical protein